MEGRTYIFSGIFVFLLSLYLWIKLVLPSIMFNTSIFVDGIWLFLLGIICGIVSGIFYFGVGIKKLNIDKFSDRSLKLMIWSIIIGFGGTALIYAYIYFGQKDSMGFILAIPFIFSACIIAIISFIYAMISFFKNEVSKNKLLWSLIILFLLVFSWVSYDYIQPGESQVKMLECFDNFCEGNKFCDEICGRCVRLCGGSSEDYNLCISNCMLDDS